MSILFSTFQLKNITLKNRIVVSPMCQYSSVDGFANDWHLVHLGTRAVGGASLVMTEAAAVTPEGRISPQDLGIWKDEHIEKLKQIVDFLVSQGAVPGIQLAHAGRKASTYSPWKGQGQVAEDEGGWTTVSSSDIPFHRKDKAPKELSIDDIKTLIQDFVLATERAKKAGFKVIEIHAAHGYLLHQFFSPISNKRNDKYGGSFENRVRILIEILEAVKEYITEDMALLVRISATDWIKDGWDLTQSIALGKLLKQHGVDLVDVSSGGLAVEQEIAIGPSYQVPFSSQIKAQTGMPVGAVGLITTAEQCEEILNSGAADLIFLARELLRNPYFPLEAASALESEIKWPPQYERAKL